MIKKLQLVTALTLLFAISVYAARADIMLDLEVANADAQINIGDLNLTLGYSETPRTEIHTVSADVVGKLRARDSFRFTIINSSAGGIVLDGMGPRSGSVKVLGYGFSGNQIANQYIGTNPINVIENAPDANTPAYTFTGANAAVTYRGRDLNRARNLVIQLEIAGETTGQFSKVIHFTLEQV